MQPAPELDLSHPLDPVAGDDDLRDRFRVEDDDAANWALRKLRAIRARQTDHERLAEGEIARVRDWLAEVVGPLQRDAAFFEGLLADYARRCRENPDDGRKTISLPSGSVTTRQGSPRWTVNPDAFLPWARQNFPDLIRVREEPDLASIKAAATAVDERAVTAAGEIIPGIVIDPATVSVAAKTTP